MENDFDKRAEEAAAGLRMLNADRSTLAGAVRVPKVLLAGYGGAAAWYVAAAAAASPGADYEPSGSAWLALVAVLIITYLIQRETGVKFRRMGRRAMVAVAGILAGSLVLFSISLALVSLGIVWAVGLTSLAAFVLATWLSGVAYRSGLDELRRA